MWPPISGGSKLNMEPNTVTHFIHQNICSLTTDTPLKEHLTMKLLLKRCFRRRAESAAVFLLSVKRYPHATFIIPLPAPTLATGLPKVLNPLCQLNR